MNSDDLVKLVQTQTGIPFDKVRQTLNSFQRIISAALTQGQDMEIPGFDEFTIVSHPHKNINLKPINQPLVSPKPVNQPPVNQKPINQPKPNLETSANSYIPYIDLSKTTITKKVLGFLPEHVARHYQVVPIEEKDNKLVVAMIDPEDREAIEFIRKKTGKELDLRICTQADLNHVFDQYSGISGELKQIVDSVEDEDIKDPKTKQTNKVAEDEILENAPAAKVVQSLVQRAVREGASDIHIEPTETEIIVRFRVDGVLKKVISLPIEILPAIVSRVKILSNMKIDETRLPQDGRFQIMLDQAAVDFRISTFPTVNGEKIVARILDKSGGILTLDQLGLKGSALTKVENGIHKAHGMILVTGPTGSGKTTTLYAVIQKLMSVTTNIVTLEDPVEYRIATINQGQVKADIGFSFASGLRSILRQDPDIIMIGEIRDYETADMAVHSALTGHIVLSTLHTNDAAGAVPRLIDMKVEPFLINSSLNAIIAQRLCRKICEDCKEPIQLDAGTMSEIQHEIDILPTQETKPTKIEFFHGKGCDNCDQTGYKGRVGIYEVFELTNDIKALVAKKVSGSELAELAIKNGMVTMRQDGIIKAIEGITTIEEIWRVTKE